VGKGNVEEKITLLWQVGARPWTEKGEVMHCSFPRYMNLSRMKKVNGPKASLSLREKNAIISP
jgi:hypothetical protein